MQCSERELGSFTSNLQSIEVSEKISVSINGLIVWAGKVLIVDLNRSQRGLAQRFKSCPKGAYFDFKMNFGILNLE